MCRLGEQLFLFKSFFKVPVETKYIFDHFWDNKSWRAMDSVCLSIPVSVDLKFECKSSVQERSQQLQISSLMPSWRGKQIWESPPRDESDRDQGMGNLTSIIACHCHLGLGTIPKPDSVIYLWFQGDGSSNTCPNFTKCSPPVHPKTLASRSSKKERAEKRREFCCWLHCSEKSLIKKDGKETLISYR